MLVTLSPPLHMSSWIPMASFDFNDLVIFLRTLNDNRNFMVYLRDLQTSFSRSQQFFRFSQIHFRAAIAVKPLFNLKPLLHFETFS